MDTPEESLHFKHLHGNDDNCNIKKSTKYNSDDEDSAGIFEQMLKEEKNENAKISVNIKTVSQKLKYKVTMIVITMTTTMALHLWINDHYIHVIDLDVKE